MGLVVGVGLGHGEGAARVVAGVDGRRQRLAHGLGDLVEPVDLLAVARGCPDRGLEEGGVVGGQDAVRRRRRARGRRSSGVSVGVDTRQQVRPALPHPRVAGGTRKAERLQPVGELAEVGVLGHPRW